MSDCSCEGRGICDYAGEVAGSGMLADKMGWIDIRCPDLAEKIQPGHNVMLFPSASLDPLLGRPFVTAGADIRKGEISICYMVVGRGTEMMTALRPKDKVRLRGPFGRALPSGKRDVYLAAGGAGVAVFLTYNKIYRENVAGFYLGLPGKGYEKCAQLMRSLAPNIKIYTDDGSFGEGNSMFRDIPADLPADAEIWACGPPGFAKALKKHCAGHEERIYLSLDSRMACGYGGCLGCVVETSGGARRLCVDGSLFSLKEVNIDELF